MTRAIRSYQGTEKKVVVTRRVKLDAGNGKNGLGVISALEAVRKGALLNVPVETPAVKQDVVEITE
jgi:hypothetical protein